jgi:UDP-glucose 4-epimerase
MSVFKGANVLVTGGAGFIGFHLCREILELGANVFIYDDLSTGKIKNVKDLPAQRVRFVKGDVRNLEKAENKIEGCKTIFHLAAQCNVAYSMKNPVEDYEINALGTLKVLEKARKMDAKVIYASTSAAYGNPETTPTSEDHPLRPISFYGLSKIAGEEECLFYYKTYSLPVVIFRIFNIYGPRGHGVAVDYLHGLRKNPNKLRILGTSNQSRDFIYISDAVEAFIVSAQSKKAIGQVYNIGSGTNISVRKLADIMIELLGLKGITQISCTGGEAWEGDLKMNYADISRIQKDLNWQPKVQLIDGLKTLIREEKA